MIEALFAVCLIQDPGMCWPERFNTYDQCEQARSTETDPMAFADEGYCIEEPRT